MGLSHMRAATRQVSRKGIPLLVVSVQGLGFRVCFTAHAQTTKNHGGIPLWHIILPKDTAKTWMGELSFSHKLALRVLRPK